MGLFSHQNKEDQDEISQLGIFLDKLFERDSYICRSLYLKEIEKYQEKLSYYKKLQEDKLLKSFCKTQKKNFKKVESILNRCEQIKELSASHNKKFIAQKLKSEKTYLDNLLNDIDKEIKLDEEQRRVVLTDEDYCLVIAGAGAGKTTTVAAKVKYLVEKQGILPEEILVVSFTNKAVSELKQRINHQLKIPCPITTFHSTGNAILHKQNEEISSIATADKLYFVLEDYFRNTVLQNPKIAKDLLTFFSSYIDNPIEFQKQQSQQELFHKLQFSHHTTLKTELEEFKKEVMDQRSKKMITICSELLRSQEEVQIANFLYLNQIDYEYEPHYPFYIEGAMKPYTPDFVIRQGERVAYIEHFGITEEGTHNRYTHEELNLYKKSVKDKITLHKDHGTTLLYTFSQYKDGRHLLEHLREKLINQGFQLNPRNDEEVLKQLCQQEGNRYIKKIISLVDRFIGNFKTNGYQVEQFDEWIAQTSNVRSKLFLCIAKECFLEYERYLSQRRMIDFADMINHSARLLRESSEVSQQIHFKYIIVDEYQDISRQRFDLVGALHDVTEAKIIAVGDDWQSIYAFSGSDITLFTQFSHIMGYAECLPISNTYRNSQEIIDIAGGFIQKNTKQIKKSLKSPKRIQDPVIIYSYEVDSKTMKKDQYFLAKTLETVISDIIEYNKKEGKAKNSTILFLGRYGFDAFNLAKSGLFDWKERGSRLISHRYPEQNIEFMTAHASKGLGYDNVVVINGKGGTYGFPSKIEDDPVLNYVIKRDFDIEAAEERRLFYVAMTRTKNRVFFVAPQHNPSEFLLELKQDYKNVLLQGTLCNQSEQNDLTKKICPMCGFPLQRKFKNGLGLNLWICTNEPEICDFMTNEIAAGKLNILKCDQCEGYLIAKKKKDGKYFLGCTNYTQDKKGCNRIIWNN